MNRYDTKGPGSPWYEAQRQRFLDAGIGRLPDGEIGRKLSVTRGTVWRWRKTLGIPLSLEALRRSLRTSCVLSDEELANRMRLPAKRGHSLTMIALRLRSTTARVKRVARAFGIRIRRHSGHLPTPPKGTVRGRRALAEYRRAECALYAPRIRGLARKGWNASLIGKRLGVHYERVARVAKWARIRIPRAKLRPDWSGVDWTMTNGEIAAILGVTAGTAGMVRNRLRREGKAVPPAPLPPVSQETIGKVVAGVRRSRERGWARLARLIRPLARRNLNTRDIARALGVGKGLVRSAAGWAGIELRKRRSLAEWLRADWTKSNEELARKEGLTRTNVSSIRRLLRHQGHPIPPSPLLGECMREDRDEALRRYYSDLAERIRPLLSAGVSRREMARRLGVTLDRLRAAIQRHGPGR